MAIHVNNVGIWGYGIGGKALVKFLVTHGVIPYVYDTRLLGVSEYTELDHWGVPICADQADFFARSAVIIPSAGIDMRGYPAIAHKIMPELDFFATYFNKPIIAVTGTLGKTTVTTLLAALLTRAGKRVALGGNIGIGLCSLIEQQDTLDYAVLEVSSFQLEHCKVFAPSVGVWTTFFPNHLDRHHTIEEYFAAKAQLIQRQSGAMISVVPAELLTKLQAIALYPHVWVPLASEVPQELIARIAHQEGFGYNWYVVAQTLTALQLSLDVLHEPYVPQLEHRIEPVRTLNNRAFVNDSKATVPQATLAAVHQFNPAKLILILGGLSKGVNRESLVSALVGQVKYIICFGAEADQLAAWCSRYAISHKKADSLAEAVKIGYTISDAGDVVLLSPAGSSFDLFSNYQERGQKFKELVRAL
jgi:UDP-N-acetylmuramoylalanine--D-glutamate ligase